MNDVFYNLGVGADVDEAYDDAVDTQRIQHGEHDGVFNVLSVDVNDVEPLPSVTSRAHAELLMRHHPISPGSVLAQPIASDNLYARRRMLLRLEDAQMPFHNLSACLNDVIYPELSAQTYLLDQLEPADQPTTELLESIELKSWRPRFKPLATPYRGKRANTFVVTHRDGDEVLASGPTLGAARREAMAIVRAGVEGHDELDLEITVRARFDDGNPLVQVQRTRSALKANFKLTFMHPKDPEKIKISSWLFVGKKS